MRARKQSNGEAEGKLSRWTAGVRARGGRCAPDRGPCCWAVDPERTWLPQAPWGRIRPPRAAGRSWSAQTLAVSGKGPALTSGGILALYVSFPSQHNGQLTLSLLVVPIRPQCSTSLQTHGVRRQRNTPGGPAHWSTFCPLPDPLRAEPSPFQSPGLASLPAGTEQEQLQAVDGSLALWAGWG